MKWIIQGFLLFWQAKGHLPALFSMMRQFRGFSSLWMHKFATLSYAALFLLDLVVVVLILVLYFAMGEKQQENPSDINKIIQVINVSANLWFYCREFMPFTRIKTISFILRCMETRCFPTNCSLSSTTTHALFGWSCWLCSFPQPVASMNKSSWLINGCASWVPVSQPMWLPLGMHWMRNWWSTRNWHDGFAVWIVSLEFELILYSKIISPGLHVPHGLLKHPCVHLLPIHVDSDFANKASMDSYSCSHGGHSVLTLWTHWTDHHSGKDSHKGKVGTLRISSKVSFRSTKWKRSFLTMCIFGRIWIHAFTNWQTHSLWF